ncbi:MAG: gas vesicle protein [Gemmatimonadota bacterium]
MTDGGTGREDWSVDLAPDDAEIWSDDIGDDAHSLVDLVNRLLDKGVVITGDVTISVAGVDLVYLGLSAVLTSVTTARRHLRRPLPGDADDR